MTLTVIKQTSGTAVAASSSPPTQIVISGASTNNAVIYTVPEGRVFNGYINQYLKINGVTLQTGALAIFGYTTSGTTRPPVTLLAGTVLTGTGSNNVEIVGVESDA